MSKPSRVNITELKELAKGRWSDIFSALAGIHVDSSNQRHHGPCPRCGGKDRFRAIDLDNGALFCNACFNHANGDGIAALGWLTGKPFKDVVATLCEYLGAKPTHKTNGHTAKPKTFATPRGVVTYFLESLTKQHGRGVRLAATWAYDTFHVLRFDLPTPPGEKQRKEFRPVHQVPLGLEGGIGWQAGYPAGPRPLYRRGELERAGVDLVTIHGGEKAADAASGLGLVATTNAGGEKAMDHTDWSPVLRFAVIAIVVDNDPAGEAFGSIMAAKIKRLKAGADVRIVKLPGLPTKGDIVEWIAAGGTRERFLEIVAKTPTWTQVDLDPEAADDDPHRLADIFLKEHCPYTRIVFWRGEYWAWNSYYRPLLDQDLRSDVTRAIKAEFDKINVENRLKAIARKKGNDEDGEEDAAKVKKVTTRLVNDVIQAIRSIIKLDGHTEQQTWLDTTQRPNCVILQNCILDLDAFLSRRADWNIPHTPNWFSAIHLNYAIDLTCKDCASPKWDAFISRVMAGDPDGGMTLQEWAGYCLTHDTAYQKFLMLEGEGNNGKSVYCAALTALLGRQNVSNVSLERFGDRFSLAATLGKLANIATECSEMDEAAEGILKAFTSGDPMQFEVKHKQSFSAIPTARFLMSANNRPRFKDGSQGLWRRMLVVKFDQTIDTKERVLGMDNPGWWEQSGELPAIFWWAVLGLHRLRQQHYFTESEKSKAAIQEYREETNPARSFLSQTCEAADQSQTVFCTTLYAGYCRWCKTNGYHPMGEMRFGKEVRRVFRNITRVRTSTRGDRPWYYTGLVFNEPSDSQSTLQF